ncbi:hypothetical protein [Olleya sp. YS]|uniref:hypothetical protein n=1 Tax=Olleya sp. YS TaxID=3028318 RepID=UPI00243425B0|nr:hypothetical protein [Olleya sp. YS]WGD34758.1 hypothetical protein Ollyesu_13330 [Olleya sp. YS]
MKTLLYLIFFLVVFTASSQTISGIVYDSISTVENIKIENLANNKITASNANGEFSIGGKVNDTLKISSLFYHEQIIVVKEIHVSESIVIDLKKITNTLEEVQLINAYKEQLADIEVVEVTLKNQILEDIKNNPHLYSRGSSSADLNIKALLGLVFNLFKNKDKYEEKPFVAIDYYALETLFTTSAIFTNDFLNNTLRIDKNYKHLFLEYVVEQNLNSELLEKSHEIYLIENLIALSKDFNKIVDDLKKDLLKKN